MIAPEDLVRMRKEQGTDQPVVPRSLYRPLCPLCKERKSRITGQRGGRIECGTCRSRRENMRYKNPKEIRVAGKQAWHKLVTMVQVLVGDEAAGSMPKFEDALPHLFNMHQGED